MNNQNNNLHQFCLTQKRAGISNGDLKKELVLTKGLTQEEAIELVRKVDEEYLKELGPKKKLSFNFDRRILGYGLIILGIFIFIFTYKLSTSSGFVVVPIGPVLFGLAVLRYDAKKKSRAQNRSKNSRFSKWKN